MKDENEWYFKLRIVQSTDRTAEVDMGTVTVPSASGVKVMVRRKKALSLVILLFSPLSLSLFSI